ADESVAALQQVWGIEGQPFAWSIDSCRVGPDGLRADIDVPEASTVALLDAAIHLARLVDISDRRLMAPAAAESIWFGAGLAGAHGRIEVYRRGGDRDGLIVDIAVQAPDGRTCVDIRSLRYLQVAGPAADEPPAKWDWS